jgi:hypothetical protein
LGTSLCPPLSESAASNWTAMSGYRRVNYYELCRLCTSSEGVKVHIFREEGRRRQLPTKIQICLPLQVRTHFLPSQRGGRPPLPPFPLPPPPPYVSEQAQTPKRTAVGAPAPAHPPPCRGPLGRWARAAPAESRPTPPRVDREHRPRLPAPLLTLPLRGAAEVYLVGSSRVTPRAKMLVLGCCGAQFIVSNSLVIGFDRYAKSQLFTMH